MVSRKLIEALKLAPEKNYKIAQKAGLHPSTLSKVINGIEPIKYGDPRVLRIGKLLGLRPEECFQE